MSRAIQFLAAGILTGLVVVVGAQARTFHVDATRGDDGRDGLKPGTAWRTLTKVNRAPLAPGDHVLFRRGQTWRGQLVPQSGDASGIITYGAFGDGNKPVLLGSVAVDRAEDWQPAGEGIAATSSGTANIPSSIGTAARLAGRAT